jgi:nucleoside-diphosphate-sugar epimerase
LVAGKLNAQRILITGSAGFLGSHLCRKLSNNGYDVVGVDSVSPSKQECSVAINGKGFLFKQVDITNREHIEKVFHDHSFDLVFHLAAIANPRSCKENFDLAFNVNVVGTKNLLLSSKKSNLVVFMSSASVYGEPLWSPTDENHPKNGSDPYSITKILGENLCYNFVKNYGQNIIIVRNFNSFGIGQADDYIVPTLIRQALKHKIEIWNSTPIRDMTYVDNTIDALLTIAIRGKGAEVYNIGSGVGTEIGRLAYMIRDNIDKNTEIIDLHKPTLGSAKLIADNTKLRNLGWRERIGFEEGLCKTINWFKSL